MINILMNPTSWNFFFLSRKCKSTKSLQLARSSTCMLYEMPQVGSCMCPLLMLHIYTYIFYEIMLHYFCWPVGFLRHVAINRAWYSHYVKSIYLKLMMHGGACNSKNLGSELQLKIVATHAAPIIFFHVWFSLHPNFCLSSCIDVYIGFHLVQVQPNN